MTIASRMTRRSLLILGAAGLGALFAKPRAALALSTAQASGLVEQVAAEITRIINSGQSEAGMIRDFERMMARRADMPTIAQSVLGPPARSASPAQIAAFSEAFQGYMARKYGKRFREFIGGSIGVISAQDSGRFVEVITRVDMPSNRTLEVRFRVWDRSGQPLFIDLLIEGVSLVITERSEVGAILDRNGGSIDATIAALRSLG